ncbi:M23 family metallopeptidase [candidate division KSB1 bacterium]|nr:M23 family metallopeptidase [candidate division KSB1 bacterium]
MLSFILHWLTAEQNLPEAELRTAHIAADSTVLAMAPPAIMIEQTIRYGQTLANLLEQSAVKPKDATRAISALQRIFDPRRLRAGHSIRVAVDSAGALHQLLYHPSPEIAVTVERVANGELTSRCDTLALESEVFLLTGEVETTLYDAVIESDETPELLLAFTDILQWDIDFFIDTQRGDRFRILFEKLLVQKPEGGSEFVRYGRILAASYEPSAASSLSEDNIAAFYFDSETGKGGYFDRDGKSFQKTFLKSPLNYRRISSHFSFGRFHPILKKLRAHTGVDFAAATGTPVVASANGMVKEIGWNGGYGNCVVIEHKNHFGTLYGHLSRFADVKVGEAVEQGQVIGYVGSTGLSTGPHLHYTLFLNGNPIDPLKIQPASGDPIAAEQLAQFFQQRDALMLQMGALPDLVYGPPLWASRNSK